MPDWLAVVLPFISALVGAALVFVGTLVRLRHERGMEQWRQLHEGAAEFAAKLGGASTAVGYAISECKENPIDQAGDLPPGHEKAVEDADWLVNEARLPLSRVRLLFGEESSVSEPALTAATELEQAVRYLKRHLRDRTPTDLQEAQKCCESARKQEGKFINAAHSKIHGRRLQNAGG
jgi:hypothetical protein